MWIAEIWRYPVKSMAGERLRRAEIRSDGIAGDRVVHVGDGRGGVITARARPRLLAHHATLGADGEPLVNGRPWRSEEVAREVRAAAGEAARLERYDGPERFDVLPLLVATDGAIAALGHDRRRLRPNLLIGGVEGLAEREWEGRVLRAGAALIGVRDLRQRCVMTTFDPDSLEQDPRVLRRIQREFGGLLALNCHVLREGAVAAGDPVELLAGAVPRPRGLGRPGGRRARRLGQGIPRSADGGRTVTPRVCASATGEPRKADDGAGDCDAVPDSGGDAGGAGPADRAGLGTGMRDWGTGTPRDRRCGGRGPARRGDFEPRPADRMVTGRAARATRSRAAPGSVPPCWG